MQPRQTQFVSPRESRLQIVNATKQTIPFISAAAAVDDSGRSCDGRRNCLDWAHEGEVFRSRVLGFDVATTQHAPKVAGAGRFDTLLALGLLLMLKIVFVNLLD